MNWLTASVAQPHHWRCTARTTSTRLYSSGEDVIRSTAELASSVRNRLAARVLAATASPLTRVELDALSALRLLPLTRPRGYPDPAACGYPVTAA